MTQVYWVRHAETELNRQGIVQGSGIDAPLTSLGQTQAQALFEAYHTLAINAIYISTLQRTQSTLAPWKDAGYALIARPELNEMGWGDLEGQPTSQKTRQLFTHLLDTWASGNIHARIPNGESASEALERAHTFIQYLEKQPANHIILVCSHGRLLRIILSHLLDGGLHTMENYLNDNTGVTLTHFSPEHGWSAEQFNCTNHLKANGLTAFYAQYHQ